MFAGRLEIQICKEIQMDEITTEKTKARETTSIYLQTFSD